ncbi:DUF397 domain-containing protein [Spirillospora sp. CA-255316]
MESLKFRTSSRCEALNQNGCVEVASGHGYVAVRDSTDRKGPILRMTDAEWRRFIRGLQSY